MTKYRSFHRVSLTSGLLSCLALSSASWATPARAELILNGSFEFPPITSSNIAIFFAPSSAIPGWSVTQGSVDIVATLRYPAFAGNQDLDLGGSTNGTIEQTFATTAGAKYLVSFAYANNPEGVIFGLNSSTGVVQLASGPLTILTNGITHEGSTVANMNYTPFSAVFTALGPFTSLAFSETDDRADQRAGLILDAVSVREVPEQASLALLALGLPWIKRRNSR